MHEAGGFEGFVAVNLEVWVVLIIFFFSLAFISSSLKSFLGFFRFKNMWLIYEFGTYVNWFGVIACSCACACTWKPGKAGCLLLAR